MWSIISAAGWPIWPLIFASVVGLAIIFERTWRLRKKMLAPTGLISEVCKTFPQFKDKQNLNRLRAHSALGGIAAQGLQAYFKGLDAQEAMQERSLEVQADMDKHLDILAMIASAAPLMGLLGTVIGMIEIFVVQGSAAQTPEALASGIAVALYNTAFGLIVAIPALVAHRLFKIQINNILSHMGKELTELETTMLTMPQTSRSKLTKED